MLPRQVRTFGARQPPIRIYSDASYKPDTDMLAGIGFAAHASIGMAAELPKHVLDLFNQRHQQITPCEAILSVIVSHNLPHVMAGRDVLWYIDNQDACELLMFARLRTFVRSGGFGMQGDCLKNQVRWVPGEIFPRPTVSTALG